MIISCVTDKGTGQVNEDAYGSTATRFWVLDGATPVVFPPKYAAKSDAKYIVEAFNDELTRQAEATVSNAQLLVSCASSIRQHTCLPAGVPIHQQPSFALAMVHVRPTDIEVTVLGDCYVVVTDDVSYRVLTDERIRPFSNKTRQLIDHLNQACLPESVAESMLRARLTENRLLMNRPGGYYVGTFGGEGFGFARTYVENCSSVRSILLCTDGFYKAFELGLVEHEWLRCGSARLSDVVRILRSVEASGGRVFGKRSDDATAVFVDLRNQCGG